MSKIGISHHDDSIMDHESWSMTYGHSSKMKLVQRRGFVWFVRVRLYDNLFDRRLIGGRFVLTKLSIHFINYVSGSIPNFQGLFRICVYAS